VTTLIILCNISVTASASPQKDLLSFGRKAFANGQYEEAEGYLRGAVLTLEAGDADPTDLALALGDLGAALLGQFRHGEAEPFLSRSVSLLRKTPSIDSRYLPVILGNLGRLYLETGRFMKAEVVVNEALTIGGSALELAPPHLAYLHTTAGRVQMGLGNEKRAEREFKQAVAILEANRDGNDQDLTPVLVELATLYYLQRKWPLSEHLLLRSLEIMDRSTRPDQGDISRVLGRLAFVYYEQKAFDKAEGVLRRAIGIRRKLFGLDDPDNAMLSVVLADILVSRGYPTEAEELYAEALEVQERTMGLRTANVAGTLERFAVLLRKSNRLSKAREMESRAESIRNELGFTISVKGSLVWQLR
jgi:tetratricopeptide (TPR) repeat protein